MFRRCRIPALRRLIISTTANIPVSLIWQGLALMPTTEKTLYNAHEAIRATVEWDVGAINGTTTSCTWANLDSTLQSLTQNLFHKVTVTDTGTVSASITLNDKDFGTGGVLVDMSGFTLDATLTIQQVHGIKLYKPTIVTSGNGTALTCGIDMSAQLAAGSRGRVVRIDTPKFGRLWKAGKTQSDLNEYSNPIRCFSAKQLIIDYADIYGVNYFAGIHGCDLLVVRYPRSRQMLQSHFTMSPQYYVCETATSTLTGGIRLAFFIQPRAYCQFDYMDLWSATNAVGQIGNNTDVPHVDYIQYNPNDVYSAAVGFNFASVAGIGGVGVNSSGQVYRATAGSGAISASPTGASNQTTGGYTWTYLGQYNDPAWYVYVLDGIFIERGVSIQTASGKHTQFLLFRDSHRQQQKNYEGSNTTVVLAGNLNASSSTTLVAQGATKLYSSQGTYTGPATPSPSVSGSNIVPANIDDADVTTGGITSTNDFLNGSSTGNRVITGNLPIDTRAGALLAQQPGTLMVGPFTTDGNGNYQLNISDAAILYNETTDVVTLEAVCRRVFKSKSGVGCQY